MVVAPNEPEGRTPARKLLTGPFTKKPPAEKKTVPAPVRRATPTKGVPELLKRPTSTTKGKPPAAKVQEPPKNIDRPDPSGDWTKVLFGGKSVPNIRNGFWNYNEGYANDHHTGVDFAMPTGTPVHLPGQGTVTSAGWAGPYGYRVVVRMDDGNYMAFNHLSKVNVKSGQNLGFGEKLGAVGSTGNSTDSHLHLEVLTPQSGGTYTKSLSGWKNPVTYLNARAGKGSAVDSGTGTGGVTGDGSTGGTGGTGGGGGGGYAGGSPSFSKKDFYDMLSANFGDIKTLLELDKAAQEELGGKSIKWAIDQIVKKKVTDSSVMLTYLNQTGWFKKYSVDISKKLIDEQAKPGLFDAERQKTQGSIEQLLSGFGLKLSPDEVAKLARNAYVYGWTNEQIINTVQEAGNFTVEGGDIGTAIEEAHAFADDHGVFLNDADLDELEDNVLDGLGSTAIQQKIRDRAAMKYAPLAERIKAGESVKSITGSYFEKAATMLEVDPQSISWSDPLFREGNAFIANDADGKQAMRPLADFEKMIKSDSRWRTTKNANEEVLGMGYDVLRRFGMVS